MQFYKKSLCGEMKKTVWVIKVGRRCLLVTY